MSEWLSQYIYHQGELFYVRNFSYRKYSWILKLGRIIVMDLAAEGQPRHLFQELLNHESTAMTRACFHGSLYSPAMDLLSATFCLKPSFSTFFWSWGAPCHGLPWITVGKVCIGWEGLDFEHAYFRVFRCWGRAWLQAACSVHKQAMS